MDFTGERFVPGDKGLLEREHNERYTFASKYSKGKSILDIACGTGYGSDILLKGGAAGVSGVEISLDATQYAEKHFGNELISFNVANAETFCSGCYDLIVSFETLEHLNERDGFLKNLHSMLKEDGMLIISTPNKSITSPLKKPHKIRNPYHKYEYTEKEFTIALLRAGFRNVEKYGQHIYPVFFKNEVFSKLFRRLKIVTKRYCNERTAVISKLNEKTARYFVFIVRKQ